MSRPHICHRDGTFTEGFIIDGDPRLYPDNYMARINSNEEHPNCIARQIYKRGGGVYIYTRTRISKGTEFTFDYGYYVNWYQGRDLFRFPSSDWEMRCSDRECVLTTCN